MSDFSGWGFALKNESEKEFLIFSISQSFGVVKTNDFLRGLRRIETEQTSESF